MKVVFVLSLLVALCPLGVQAALLDPTAPPGTQLSSKPAARKPVQPQINRLQLQQILYRDDSQQVVINNQRLSVGDKIHGFKIWRIEPRRVGVEHSGQRYWLALYSSVIKK